MVFGTATDGLQHILCLSLELAPLDTRRRCAKLRFTGGGCSMERIRVITHQGQRILLVDCTGCHADEVARIADQVPKAVEQEASGTVLLLADFSNTQLSREAMERIKVAAAFNRRHLKRSAWVLTGNLPKPAQTTVETFSTREIPVFGTRDEALDYLVHPDAKQASGS